MDCDGVVDDANRTWNQVVPGKPLGTFRSRGVDLDIGMNRQPGQHRRNRGPDKLELLSRKHPEQDWSCAGRTCRDDGHQRACSHLTSKVK
jgi:hypothetical protein